MKKPLYFIVIIMISIFLISNANSLTIKSEAERDVLIPQFNQPAKFTLTINADASEAGNYNLYTLTDVNLRPSSPFSIKQGVNKIDVYVYPIEQLKQRGFYSFSYTLNNINAGDYEDQLTVNVVDLEEAIEISSDSISPDTGEIKFYIENKQNAKIESINAKFSSILFDDIEKEFTLEPFSRTKITIDVDDAELKKTKAGSYIITGEFKTNKGVKTIEGKMYIGENKGIKTQEDSSGFIIRTNTITKINTGNVKQMIKIDMKKTIFSRLFTTFNQEPILVDRNGFIVNYVWTETLQPSDTITIKSKTNYIFPLLIIIVAGLMIYGFKRYMQTKIEVKKTVHHVKTKGGEFALKVRINVKARKPVENVSLIDKIPGMVKVYEKFEKGTREPDRKDTKNRRLQWDIGNLNPGEERVFSYVVYSKIGFVGKFSLPPATAVFEQDDDIHEVESNTVYFLAEQTRKEE